MTDRPQHPAARTVLGIAASALALLSVLSCEMVPDPGQSAVDRGEARKLTTGEPLPAPPIAADKRAGLEAQLDAARARLAAAPGDAEALIGYGRRLGYVGRFREAADVFTQGIERHPDDARLWRFRGHRWITLRQFDRAIADLDRAAALIAGEPDEVEPAGTPNARGIDLDTLHENVFYHLALAHYLRGEWGPAAENWRRCRDVARNADGVCMASYWLAMALARAGRGGLARAAVEPVRADMDVVEYQAYHQLALVWKGERDGEQLLASTPPDGETAVDFATIGYGVGCWHWCRGERDRALQIWRQVEAGPMWHAFGHIAAEAELARLQRR